MSDQAQKLRKKVNQNKLSAVIDDIKNIHDISEVYSNLVEESQSSASVIMFISAKGGTGKTYIASMFAHYLSEKKKKTAIIDLNKYYLDSLHYFSGAKQIKINKDTVINNSCFIEDSSKNGAKYIFTIENEGHGVENQLLKIIIQQAKLSNFDYILVDTPVMSPDSIGMILPLADIVYLTASCDYASFCNSSQLITRLNSALNQKLDLSIIYNFADSDIKKYKELFLEIMKDKINIKTIDEFVITYDRILSKLNKSNYNTFEFAKHSISAREVERVVEKSVKANFSSPTLKPRKKSLFNRIFGLEK